MTKLIIFDLDGVLVEAKQIHYDTLNRALKELKARISRFRISTLMPLMGILMAKGTHV